MDYEFYLSLASALSGGLGAFGSLLLAVPFLEDLKWRTRARRAAALLAASGAPVSDIDQYWLDQVKVQIQPQSTWVQWIALLGCSLLCISLIFVIPAVKTSVARVLVFAF